MPTIGWRPQRKCVRRAWYESNSLPAIFAAARLTLVDEYQSYAKDIFSITLGLNRAVKKLPVQEGS